MMTSHLSAQWIARNQGKKPHLHWLIWDLWVALPEDWGSQEQFQPCSEVGVHGKMQLRCCFCGLHALSQFLVKSKCWKSCLNGWGAGAVLVSSKSLACVSISLIHERKHGEGSTCTIIFSPRKCLHLPADNRWLWAILSWNQWKHSVFILLWYYHSILSVFSLWKMDFTGIYMVVKLKRQCLILVSFFFQVDVFF